MTYKNEIISIKTSDLFDFKHSIVGKYFASFIYPWEIIPHICAIIATIEETLDKSQYITTGDHIWIHKTADVASTALLLGPCVIGERTIVRHGALIRGNAIIGSDCTIGNSAEIKNSILFNHVSLGHYNYIGDSVLGYKVHFGAGAIASNVRLDKQDIVISHTDRIGTGLRKLGAMIGDMTEIGCNSVINPGTIIGKNSTIFPLSCVVGVIAPNSIIKWENHRMHTG